MARRVALSFADGVAPAIQTWQDLPGAPHTSVTDVHPQVINRVVNFNDVLFIIFASQGDPYPPGDPTDPCN